MNVLDGKAKFIAVEGQDGAGKTTLVKYLTSMIIANGGDAVYLREPGGTYVGEQIRGFILHGIKDGEDSTLNDVAAMHLLLAARAQNMVHIKELMARGTTVICDRWHPSTLTYQSIIGNADPDYVKDACIKLGALYDCVPDTYVLVDMDPSLAFQRKAERNIDTDRMDTDTLQSQITGWAGTRKAVTELSDGNFITINNDGSLEEAKAHILTAFGLNQV